MRRILRVGNTPNLLNKRKNSEQEFAGELRIVFAEDGPAALNALREAPVDVVVSDMAMPGMDGVALFERLKEEYPDVVRIILCRQPGNEAILRALPVAHQVLAQPLEAATLLNVIERSCRLRALLTDSLLKRVGDIERLPSLPAVYQELMTAMADPEVSTQKVGKIVEKDIAMAAKLLQLVNSACFGLPQHITSVDQAVVYLGMELLKNLALTVHVFTALEDKALRSGFSFESQQEHALLTAKVAKQFLPNAAQGRDAFTAALLHDIGKLVLAVCIPAKFKTVVQICRTSGRPAYEVEAEILGVTHAEVGAYLLSLWGLPYPIVEAVAFHHNPAAAIERQFDVPSAVSLADALVHEAMGHRSAADLKPHLESLNAIGKLPAWTKIAHDAVQQLTPQAV